MSLSSVIVGFGKSGRSLHLPGLLHAKRLCKDEDVFANGQPVAVDPRLPAKARKRGDRSVTLTRSLDDVVELVDPEHAVVHVCTPPGDRGATIAELADRGFTRVICEKPLGGSIEELHEVLSHAHRHQLDIAVASPWLFSSLTARLRRLVTSGELGALKAMHIVQSKPRFTRTRDDIHHPSAFEVEVPHSMSVALDLAGWPVTIEDASHRDLWLDGEHFAAMGVASARLRHATGAITTIESDLTAPVRQRSIELEFEAGEAIGHYPVAGDDQYAQLSVRPAGAPPRPPSVLADEQFTRMMIECYGHWAGVNPPPVSDVDFNVRVMDVMAQVKERAGLRDPGRIILDAPIPTVVT